MNAIKRTFELGEVIITSVTGNAVSFADIGAALERHAAGDWGEVGPDDWEKNEEALEYEECLFSKYWSSAGKEFWVVTEGDLSETVVCMPGEPVKHA